MTMYSYSTDGEAYHGEYPTKDAAIAESIKELSSEGGDFWVGECREPIPPEQSFDVASFLDELACREDYDSEAASEWSGFHLTEAELSDFESVVQSTIGRWFRDNDLMPEFYAIGYTERYFYADGKVHRHLEWVYDSDHLRQSYSACVDDWFLCVNRVFTGTGWSEWSWFCTRTEHACCRHHKCKSAEDGKRLATMHYESIKNDPS